VTLAARRPIVLVIATVWACGGGLFLAVRSASASPAPARFGWRASVPAPSGWKHAALRSGGGILFYPPSLNRITSDPGSVSVAEKDRSGRILVYPNATPKEGNERLGTWPAFRIRHARSEDDAVHEDGYAFGLRFLDGKGSCVIDDSKTRVKVNHYREIACFIQGRTAAGVLVAAALQPDWPRARALLERAVSAYRA
jgi:hypothetical protein